MNVECLLDTNVLVYAAAGTGSDAAKRRRALRLIETEDFGLSAQVLQEFYVTVVRKIAVPLTAERALEWIEQFESFPCAVVDSSLVKIGIELSARYRISYWDAAIVAAADVLGAKTVFSEDMGDGQRYGRVLVRNPFATTPAP
jgi:predicted nucleic acid-binding protein